LPYTTAYTHNRGGDPTKLNKHCLVPAYTEDHSFLSNAFLVKYIEEEIEFGHVVQFKSEVDSSVLNGKAQYFLTVEMLFIEIGAIGGASKALSFFADQNASALNMKVISKRTYKLVSALDDVFAGYIPVVFDEYHYSLLNLTVHFTMLEFKLRQIFMDEHTADESDIENTEPVIKVEFAEVLPAEVKPPERKKKLKNIELVKYLFGDLEGNLPTTISTSDIEEVYEDYVVTLIRVHNKLNATTLFLAEQVLSKTSYKELKDKLKSIEGMGSITEGLEILAPELVTSRLVQRLNTITGSILEVWYFYLNLIKTSPKEIVSNLLTEYTRMLNETFSYFIFHRIIDISVQGIFKNSAGENKERAKELRKSNYFDVLKALPIQDQVIFGKIENIPLFFEDLYTNKSEVEKREVKGNQMLFVLVHGLRGSSLDMRFIKNHLFSFYPTAFFLCSSSNEKKTEGDIETMGVNLAEEIQNFIKINALYNLGKISFIGHSLGGIIIRAALPYLEEYKNQMHTFMTLSSPHVGYLIQTSTLVNAGMWVLKAWQKSKCLEQLLCADSKDLNACLMYRLSKAKVNVLSYLGA